MKIFEFYVNNKQITYSNADNIKKKFWIIQKILKKKQNKSNKYSKMKVFKI